MIFRHNGSVQLNLTIILSQTLIRKINDWSLAIYVVVAFMDILEALTYTTS